ncbi:polysaccharide deacetylase family protein [Oryzicola mucosus]|uniref:Chitooligosaccharide deacetylase n=1 Tax=Oryzicola mucosus TaxID=2767425 RepID=A0A8J6PXB9_9HYPH|nr:polysaccharide deacetylase family protein [Oryzicola mucosus]MBD0415937.1 polysaccharide deacetylase family protein [Oryzicola mucosus]
MKYRRLVVPAVVIATAVVGFYGLFQLSKARSFQLFGRLVDRVDTQSPVIALTFDDGPTPKYTEPVLELLREKNVKATFFLTGKETEENPIQARAILTAGHQIGNHTYSHPNLTLALPATISDEIERTDAAIRATGYEGEIVFRPPYGKKLFTLPWYLSQHDRTTVMWDVEPESYPDIANDPEAMTQHVLSKARNGSIVIMHVMYKSREATRQALPNIIDGLRERGFRFVTVSELMSSTGQ